MVATILSAQCTDERVNIVTQNLFAKYPEPEDIAKLPLEVIKKAIYSTGFYNNKSKSIKGMSMIVMGKYKGELPQNIGRTGEITGCWKKNSQCSFR